MSPPRQTRRIACISTSRADAGIYRPLLRALVAEPDWRIFLLSGGTHGAEGYGDTLEDIRRIPGLTIIPAEHHAPGDSPVAVAESAGRAIPAFARAIDEARPDLVFVLGDRAEMLAAALAAVIAAVPIAHLHGGDVTRGAYDDQCRNAITKLAHLHFPALPEHAERIRAMGEEPWRIHAVGALALDDLADFRPEPVAELSAAIGLDFAKPTCVVVYHPETLAEQDAGTQMDIVLDGLTGLHTRGDAPAGHQASSVAPMQFLFLAPNADVGREAIADRLLHLRPNSHSGNRSAAASSVSVFSFQFSVLASLPQRRFWSCLHYAKALIGNSSAGPIEAASLKLPVVNIGNRQAGRFAPRNVINSPLDARRIRESLAQALRPDFRQSLSGLVNPYGEGRASQRILKTLKSVSAIRTLLVKSAIS